MAVILSIRAPVNNASLFTFDIQPRRRHLLSLGTQEPDLSSRSHRLEDFILVNQICMSSPQI